MLNDANMRGTPNRATGGTMQLIPKWTQRGLLDKIASKKRELRDTQYDIPRRCAVYDWIALHVAMLNLIECFVAALNDKEDGSCS